MCASASWPTATPLHSGIWRSRTRLWLPHWRSKTATAILGGRRLTLAHYRRGDLQRRWRHGRAGLGTETLPAETWLRSRLLLRAGRCSSFGRGR
jgi:hypothetical protein